MVGFRRWSRWSFQTGYQWNGYSAIQENLFPASVTVNGQRNSLAATPAAKQWPVATDVSAVNWLCTGSTIVKPPPADLRYRHEHGGGVAWEFAGSNSINASTIAAFVPVCGSTTPTTRSANTMAAANLPIWATHNDGDPTVPVSTTKRIYWSD